MRPLVFCFLALAILGFCQVKACEVTEVSKDIPLPRIHGFNVKVLVEQGEISVIPDNSLSDKMVLTVKYASSSSPVDESTFLVTESTELFTVISVGPNKQPLQSFSKASASVCAMPLCFVLLLLLHVNNARFWDRSTALLCIVAFFAIGTVLSQNDCITTVTLRVPSEYRFGDVLLTTNDGTVTVDGLNAEHSTCIAGSQTCKGCCGGSGQCSTEMLSCEVPPISNQALDAPNGDARSFGIWSPQPSLGSNCSKEYHDSFYVIGPDGKRYPTWHPPYGNDPFQDNQYCLFGHEHGQDPSEFRWWHTIKAFYAYDSTGRYPSGYPFGYSNEQIDVYYGHVELERHEDNPGHKVHWAHDLEYESDTQLLTGWTCDISTKFHQGTASKDAFANNLHEINYFGFCHNTRKESYMFIVTRLGFFGSPGEFSKAACRVPGLIEPGKVEVGFSFSNPLYPGDASKNNRRIGVVECAPKTYWENTDDPAQLFYAASFYEHWQAEADISHPLGPQVGFSGTVVHAPLGIAVFDPIRYFDPAKPNGLAYAVDACYWDIDNPTWVDENPGWKLGGSCLQIRNEYWPERIYFNDSRSPFTSTHRESYFQGGRISNDHPGASSIYFTSPWGGNTSTSPFNGSIKQYVSLGNWNQVADMPGASLDPFQHGSWINHKFPGIHAPN